MKKKYVLTSLLALSIVLSLSACGKSETTSTNNNADIENASDISTDADAQSETKASSSDNTTPTPSVTYEGIDFNSTLPGREWVQTTFPGVIDEPKIVIFNDETNKKQIVENGELVVYNLEDTFAMYLPEGVIITEYSYLLDKVTGYGCCEELTFDTKKLEEYEQRYKGKYGGAKYNVILDNNGTEQELSCIISLGE